MNRFIVYLLLISFVMVASCSALKKGRISGQSIWNIDNLKSIGGYTPIILGSPEVINTPKGKALQFDGEKDGLRIDTHVLAGADKFTLEIVFRPDAGGLEEQRFFHLQETGSNNRFLIETRLTDDDQWYIDTFIASGSNGHTLMNSGFLHPVGEWYNATLVYDGKEMSHYVNGVKELSAYFSNFIPHKKGQTSIGVRINEVYWFKGAIRTARFTPWVLEPDEFLKP